MLRIISLNAIKPPYKLKGSLMKYIVSLLILLQSFNTYACYENDPYEQCEQLKEEQTILSPSFKESTFDFNSEEEANAKFYCYKVSAKGVCAEAAKHVRDVNYNTDRHDAIIKFKCDDSSDVVKMSYGLYTNYTDGSAPYEIYNVKRKIEKCE